MLERDQQIAAALDASRQELIEAADDALETRPWLAGRLRGTDADLVRAAAWLARKPDVERTVLDAGLRLLASAREELDQIETGLLFAARAAGMAWSEIAEALSLQSRQAAQQRFDRVRTRLDGGPST